MQIELIDQRLQAILLIGLGQVGHFQDCLDVVFHTHLAKYRRFLGQIADPETSALVHGQVGDLLVIEKDLTAVGPDESDHHVEAGSFPCTIGPEQADDLPLVDLQGDIIDHRAASILFDQMFSA